MKTQKTVLGFSFKNIINKIRIVQTMGGHYKEHLTLPNGAYNRYYEVSWGVNYVELKSGIAEPIRVAQ